MIQKLLIITLSIIISAMQHLSIACTSAIIGADATPDGRPLLWKLRDTNTTDNKVEYIASDDGAYSYVALFNANDTKCEQAWIGMNEVGFAIMNTASYNIKDDKVPQSKMDREGYVMTIALRSCKTVDDFASLLNQLPRPMGVEANFGVIDAEGNGAYFETNNHSYVKYDIKEAPGNVLIRTNYSHSGRKDEGYGYIREANASHLLLPYVETKSVTAEVLTEVVSRSFYHDLKKTDYATVNERWVIDQDFIPRNSSSASVVVEGVSKGENPDATTIWSVIGYPPCSYAVASWVKAKNEIAAVIANSDEGRSSVNRMAVALKREVFPISRGNGSKYMRTDVIARAIETLRPYESKSMQAAATVRDRIAKEGFNIEFVREYNELINASAPKTDEIVSQVMSGIK
jgi:hypothetical protein